jgi:acetoin utilization deacetylase AcuC-like enzyme
MGAGGYTSQETKKNGRKKAKMIKTYFVPESLFHDSGPGHPESAERARTLNTLLTVMEKEGLSENVSPPKAVDLSLFRLAHDPLYIDFLERPKNILPIDLDPDTRLSSGSLDAMKGLSGAISMINRDRRSAQSVFLVARPPGHHARKSAGMGFCLVNTIATQALALQKSDPSLRIAIYDFDVHHGNGTEEILGKNAGTLYISTHQYPFYPGTGSGRDNYAGDRWEGILDIPLPQGTGDNDYSRILETSILPRLVSFEPDILLVSAGFDGHREDPLGGFLLTEKTYQEIGNKLSSTFPSAFIVSILEGGYNLQALTRSVRSYMEGLNR